MLAGPDTCWYVANGSVELFAVRQSEDGSLSGTQSHLRSVERGELLFGFNPIAASATVFVVRGNETAELVTLPLATLTANKEIAEPLAQAIDRWAVGLTRALCPTLSPSPNVESLLAPGQETAIAPNARFGPAGDVVWIKGGGAFVYCATVEVAANDGYFPLSPEGWMEPEAEGHVTPIATLSLIADNALVPALGRFNDTVLHGLADSMEAAQASALARQLQRERRDVELLENAFGDALVVNRQADYVAHDLVSTDALTKAVARLAVLFKAPQPIPDRHLEDLDPDQQLARLLASANLASREIELVGVWWKSDGMPMIAWTKSGQPIVLWSVARRKYRYFDPADGRTGRVDLALAQTLSNKAHAIYPTLLKDRVSPSDLLRTGFRGGARDIIYMILFGAIAALIALITPSLTATLINVAIPESAQRTVIELTGVLISVAVVTAIFQFLQATSLLRVETIFESQAQAALWQRLMRLPSAFFRGFNSGNLAVRAMGLSQIRSVLSSGLTAAMLGGIFSFLNFIVMIAYGGWLALAALAMMIVTLAFGLTANIMRVRRLRLAIKAHDDLAGLSVQSIAAIKKVRVAGAEDRLASKLIGLHNRQRTYDYAARSIENWLRAYNTVIPLLSTAVFYAVVEFLFTDPPATGNFVAFTAAYGTFIVGITGMLNAVTMGLTAFVLYERLRPILETGPETSAGSLPPGELSGKIEVNRVTFRYLIAGRPVLNDVSLTIEPGQFVAIVGPSGSGKSTLLRLLLGFERPHSGSILYDGKDLSRLDVDAVRLQCGAILQNMQVLGGSIFENIAGSRPLTMDDAWRAAKLACFDQDIKALPMQMHTVVNDGGTFSGGEKQRLMLARALAGNPKILFMDEATSALDNATQAVVAKSLAELDLTRVVIAHRLSTIKDADVIYVMQNGKIIDSGTAETLLEKSSLFAAFVERQQIEY